MYVHPIIRDIHSIWPDFVIMQEWGIVIFPTLGTMSVEVALSIDAYMYIHLSFILLLCENIS
jgi:hypothetical protein